jgi:hypothetical protein
VFSLRNQHLIVSILDPIQDQDRLGPRFCTGGYIYQIEDARHGVLCSGPEFPNERPAVTNGQGLPEVFQFTLYEDEREIEGEKLIIGVGIVDKRDPHLPYHLFANSQTQKFCEWQISQSENFIRMETMQAYKQWAFQLTREVRLEGRTLSSATQIKNFGAVETPFRWFAHPFFPINPDWRCCQFLMPMQLPKNPAYFINAEKCVEMNNRYDWREGYFQLLEGCQNQKFSAIQFHPRLKRIYVSGDFPLLKVAIWANERTFSFEPFYQDAVLAGHEKSWALVYHL